MVIPDQIKTWLEQNPRKALFTGIGFVAGLLIATIGLAATLVAVLCAAGGYLFALDPDERKKIMDIIKGCVAPGSQSDRHDPE